jgi:hypothetical protein
VGTIGGNGSSDLGNHIGNKLAACIFQASQIESGGKEGVDSQRCRHGAKYLCRDPS